VPIIPLLQGRAFGPEDIKVMSTAFKGALNALGLMDAPIRSTSLSPRRSSKSPKQASVILADYGTALLNHCKGRSVFPWFESYQAASASL
jgi:hypothetical protein